MVKIEFDIQELTRIVRQAVAAELDAREMSEKSEPAARRTMTIDEFCEFTGLAKQTAYKLTSANKIPFAKQGKRIWFDRSEVEQWLLSNRRATTGEAAQQANEYIMQSAARRNRNR